MVIRDESTYYVDLQDHFVDDTPLPGLARHITRVIKRMIEIMSFKGLHGSHRQEDKVAE